MEKNRQMIRGCLLGLAVGDAMGHTVDGKTLDEIREDYGPNGLLGYDLVNGYADVTSYTQLAAFSANGLLIALTGQRLYGKMAQPVRYIAMATREWSRSQHFCPQERNHCWLSTVPEMKRRYCMDTRMLDALSRERLGTPEEPLYPSDHPGALTEVIPVALLGQELGFSQEELDRLGAEAVALTHGDAEAFLSGAVLTHLLCAVAQTEELPTAELILQTVDAIQLQFGRAHGQTTKIWELLQLAISLSGSGEVTQMEAMQTLGCRSAAEVLAGAMYAVLTSGGDFDTAMITAVNHSGRSAAVAAITGGIMGAVLGSGALPEFYLECLEPTRALTELADDMSVGCPLVAGSNLFDDDWDRKYLHGGT